MIFTTTKRIRFSHCDPAGIVFYPRYYTLLHETQEDWLTHIGHPEHRMIASGFGVPVVNMQTDFKGMSRFGETVRIDLDLWKLGNSSLGMRYVLYSNESNESGDQEPINHQKSTSEIKNDLRDVRLVAKSVVVFSQVPGGKALRIPDDIRAAMQPYLNEESPA